jgi:Protein of unknown function (DUF2924)
MPNHAITKSLAALLNSEKPSLSALWCQLFKRQPPPKIRKELMIRVIAHRLQEQEFGELSNAARRRLSQLARAFEADPDTVLLTRSPLKPGTRLVRQWKEKVHVVEVETEGYAYKGSSYHNLSEIARLITGTRWSGPLFFGLKGKQTNTSQQAQ